MGFFSLRTRLRLQVLGVTLVCGYGLAKSVSSLQEVLEFRNGPGDGPVLSRVEDRSHTVRRKRANRYVWGNVVFGEAFFHREALQTGPGAHALLRDGNQRSIEVGESSLVVFDRESENLLRVLDGSVVISDSSGERSIAASPSGRESISIFGVKLAAPRLGEELFVLKDAKSTVTFRWGMRQVQAGAKIQVELSSGSEFKSPVVRPLSEGQSSADFQLRGGSYFWRLTDGKSALSRTLSFRVSEVRPASLKSVSFDTEKGSVVSWGFAEPNGAFVAAAASGVHFIEISPSAEFKEIVQRKEIASNQQSAKLDDLPRGTYHVRVQSQYGKLLVSSRALSFSAGESQSSSGKGMKSRLGAWVGGADGLFDRAPSSDLEGSQSGGSASPAPDSADRADGEGRLLPEGIQKSNTELTRAPLNWSIEGDSILLNWFYPSDFKVMTWEVWKVNSRGEPVTLLVSAIPGDWRGILLSLARVLPGDLLMVAGNAVNSRVLSTIVQFSVSVPVPPENLDVQVNLLRKDVKRALAGESLVSDYVGVRWTHSQSVQRFLVRLFQGDAEIYSQYVSGGLQGVGIFTYLYEDPDFHVEVQAERGEGPSARLSPPISAWKCLGDVNGDNKVEPQDLTEINNNFTTTGITFLYSPDKVIVRSTNNYDVNADARVSDLDVDIVSRFTEIGNCIRRKRSGN